jgi:hexosaminidase
MKKIYLLFAICIFHQTILSQSKLSEQLNLMPWPKEIVKTSNTVFIKSSFTVEIEGKDTKKRVHNAVVKFLRRLSNRTGVFIENGFPTTSKNTTLSLSFDKIAKLSIHTDESYSVRFNNTKIEIKATTDIGVLRGLETLLQLVNNDAENYFFESVTIDDSPRFVWRGLMIDAARHFQPVNVLKRNLDAMASVKLNVFHWHLTDDQGFRVESKIYPKLQTMASDGLYYTQEQIKEVVKYASNLGIRVIPEFDVPGHASAILTAYPELSSKDGYTYTIERFSGVFNPTLNPSKEMTYTFLENLFNEIAPLFPDEYFHIGGDENEGKHWDENEEIQAFKKKHNLKNNHDLQTYFNIKLEKILKKLGKKLMGWDEILTPSTPTTAVIHSWRGKQEGLKQSTLIEAAKKGYQTVLSNGYYIDRMLSVKHHYLVDPIADAVLTKEERKRVLGAEATMWSELVTPLTIDSRIWPRTAAIAERYWSQKEISDVDNMLKRLQIVSNHLEELGITHLKNKGVILRNISNYQEINALKTLSNLCEPLKIYSRNKGGTEYKTFSPFTLFADACTADAKDALLFNNEVALFIKNNDKKYLKVINEYLKIWMNNYMEFSKMDSNPKIYSLEILSKNLSSISEIIYNSLQKKNIDKEDLEKSKRLIIELEKPYQDAELMVVKSFNLLIKYCNTTK